MEVIMRWVVLFLLLAFPNFGAAEDLAGIKQEATECRQYITEIGLEWPVAPWNCREEPARSLSQALQYDLEFFGGRDQIGQNSPACQPLIKVGLENCDYTVRLVLAGFLAMYGVDLFPTSDQFGESGPGSSGYYGTAEQNGILIEAVRRNAELLADGDLTAEEVLVWR